MTKDNQFRIVHCYPQSHFGQFQTGTMQRQLFIVCLSVCFPSGALAWLEPQCELPDANKTNCVAVGEGNCDQHSVWII